MSEWRPLSFPVLMMTLACTTGLLTGCGGDDKVADLATPSTEPASSPVVPPYTTTLTLDEEQKKAADEAVVAVSRFTDAANSVYHGTAEQNELPKVASGSALKSLRDGHETLVNKKLTVRGDVRVENYRIVKVVGKKLADSNSSSYTPDVVQIRGCVPYSEITFLDSSGRPIHDQNNQDSLFDFKVVKDKSWKVNQQELVKKSCD